MSRSTPQAYRSWVAAPLVLALMLSAPAAAQQPPPQAPQQMPASAAAVSRGYLVFLRGTPLGREDVTVHTDASGTTISSQSRLATPINVTLRRAEAKYRPDWSPESFVVEAAINGGEATVRTNFKDGSAVSTGLQGTTPFTRTDPVDPQTLVLMPNTFFGAFEALTRRLAATPALSAFRTYVVPQAEIAGRVSGVFAERMQVGTTVFDVRRYEIVLANPGGDVAVNLTAATDGSLIRVSLPAQALDIVRDDVAASTSRTQVFSNPGDEAVVIPAYGFNLGATLTRPSGAGGAGQAGSGGAVPAARLPAIVLLAGSGVDDRDGAALGVPTLAQLAGALANAGFLAVRYDKRGYGQSGGRAESATLSDYAEDARAVVKWLADRKDIDPKRIGVVGHSEGAWIGMLAASRDKRISALVSISGPGTTGAELVLEQQQATLAQMTLTPQERDARVAMQKQIQTATLTGKGWEGVPPALRRQADTPWFQSLLAFDPARTIKGVRQPLLFVHGVLDKQVPVAHVDRLADLARKTSDSKSVEVVTVRGVNHLLIPAVTGEVAEYGTLQDRNVSPDVSAAIGAWLTKTFAAIR